MKEQKSKPHGLIRVLLIWGLAAIFVGLILFSILKVSYPVDSGRKNELTITELSLTDSVKRDKQGNLTVPQAEKKGTGGKSGKSGKACPT